MVNMDAISGTTEYQNVMAVIATAPGFGMSLGIC